MNNKADQRKTVNQWRCQDKLPGAY